MRGELVAIDLETTGLDPYADDIIEIGAVRLRDGEVIDTYETLIDPGRPIPALVTSLTGIRGEDIANKPSIHDVLPALRAFVGSAPLIGHNIGFDMSFLYRQGIFQNNLRIDTYDLVSVLMPRAPRYNLTSLSAQIGIDLENAHRALDDARATAHLYWMLWQKALALPYGTLREICEAAENLDWDARPVFDAALRERAVEQGEKAESISDDGLPEWFGKERIDSKPLRPNDALEALNPEHVISLLDQGGTLEQKLPNYEFRPQQVEMTRALVDAFNQGEHIMIEAGTGTGKSIAYLVPSILWATRNNERVVISTNTINLQEQLLLKDIPTLREALAIPFNAAVMKGRSNYLCPRRLTAVRRRRPTNNDELRTLAKIMVWLLESRTGDRGEISLRGTVENITWQRLSAEDEGCTMDRCRTVMEGACPFYKARKAAEAAHIVIVNHALLISDAITDNRVLPEYNYLILDEAHHLEDATTNGLSFRLDEATLRRRLADLGGPRKGLLGSLLGSVQKANVSDKEANRLETFIQVISDATSVMEIHISGLFSALRSFVNDIYRGRPTDYLTQIRVTEPLRSKASFSQVQTSWNTLAAFFEAISEAMEHLTVALTRMESYDIPDYNDLVSSTATAARYLLDVQSQLSAFTTQPDPNAVYWISVPQENDNLALHSAPLHVGPLIDRYLWSPKEMVAMTSATLQTNGSFDYIRERLKAEGVTTLEVGSPFNYRESTLVYVPNDIPDPNDRQGYQQAIERGIIELAAALNGRVLGLFTSYAQLRQTAQAITPRLALGNITVYDQSDGSSRQALLDGFKSTERAVLLGTKSFWEGVDIPGESLSALVITRLPFAVPTDPIFAARSETYANSFMEYALPDAILRFRQGFGRLIRTKSDCGVVAIFDSRVLTKSYGMNFIEALPDCTVRFGPLHALPDSATEWLKRSNTI